MSDRGARRRPPVSVALIDARMACAFLDAPVRCAARHACNDFSNDHNSDRLLEDKCRLVLANEGQALAARTSGCAGSITALSRRELSVGGLSGNI